jgi:hypothetical protein
VSRTPESASVTSNFLSVHYIDQLNPSDVDKHGDRTASSEEARTTEEGGGRGCEDNCDNGEDNRHKENGYKSCSGQGEGRQDGKRKESACADSEADCTERCDNTTAHSTTKHDSRQDPSRRADQGRDRRYYCARAGENSASTYTSNTSDEQDTGPSTSHRDTEGTCNDLNSPSNTLEPTTIERAITSTTT